MRVNPSERLGSAPKPRRKFKSKKTSSSFVAKAIRVTLIAVAAILVATVLVVLPFRWINPPTTAFMVFDDVEFAAIQHRWVPWDDMSDSLAIAVIASEDQRFLQHYGIDFASIQKSLESAKRGNRMRGASTITQQVAKNIYLWRGRSFLRKGMEAYLALWVDALWPKRRIMEIYLNIAELGPGIYGVGTASDTYFGKPPARINDAEAALLAAVLPNPVRLNAGKPSEYLRERQAWIVGQMQRMRREKSGVFFPPI